MIRTILVLIFALGLFADSNFDAIRLENAIDKFIESKLGRSEVEIRALLGSQEFYEDGVKATIEFTDKKIGSTNLLMKFILDGKVLKRYHIPVNIKVVKKMLVYSQDIRSGSELGYHNLKYTEVLTDSDNIIDIKSLISYTLKRNVSENKLVEEKDLETPKVIESGEQVELVVANSKVKVTSKAKALNSASIGEKVRIERKGSKSMLEGIALQDGSVLIK